MASLFFLLDSSFFSADIDALYLAFRSAADVLHACSLGSGPIAELPDASFCKGVYGMSGNWVSDSISCNFRSGRPVLDVDVQAQA